MSKQAQDPAELAAGALNAAQQSAKSAEPEPAVERKLLPIERRLLQFFELQNSVWRCVAPRGYEPQDLVDRPELLTALQTPLKRRDLVWFDAADETSAQNSWSWTLRRCRG